MIGSTLHFLKDKSLDYNNNGIIGKRFIVRLFRIKCLQDCVDMINRVLFCMLWFRIVCTRLPDTLVKRVHFILNKHVGNPIANWMVHNKLMIQMAYESYGTYVARVQLVCQHVSSLIGSMWSVVTIGLTNPKHAFAILTRINIMSTMWNRIPVLIPALYTSTVYAYRQLKLNTLWQLVDNLVFHRHKVKLALRTINDEQLKMASRHFNGFKMCNTTTNYKTLIIDKTRIADYTDSYTTDTEIRKFMQTMKHNASNQHQIVNTDYTVNSASMEKTIYVYKRTHTGDVEFHSVTYGCRYELIDNGLVHNWWNGIDVKKTREKLNHTQTYDYLEIGVDDCLAKMVRKHANDRIKICAK